MRWILRVILVVAVASGLARASAVVIREQVAVVQPTPAPTEPAPTPGTIPKSPEPSPSPEPTPTKAPDIQIDVTLPTVPPLLPDIPIPPPIPTPPPILPPPPPIPSCINPGSSGGGTHTGWTAQGRECAGNPNGGFVIVLAGILVAVRRRVLR